MLTRALFLFLFALCSVVPVSAANKPFTLVIDAGHGGKDTGASGAFSKEKDINLAVALAFGRYVERNSPDVKVIYTRTTDVFIPLMERANIANRNKADLFISVHTNALPAGRIARGFETYTLGMHRASDNLDVAKRENSVILVEKDYKQTYQGFDPRSAESYIMFELIQGQNMTKSVELAKLIQSNVCATASRADKGVHQAGFLVLRETSMPGCLVELGFITTPDEEQALNNPTTIDALGKGLYQAFTAYQAKYDGRIVVPYKKERAKEETLPAVFPQQAYQPAKNVEKKATEPKRLAEPSAKKEEKRDTLTAKAPETTSAAPIFKVQVLTTSRKLRKDDAHLKGLSNYEVYEEDNLFKYTVGASTDFREISKLRRELTETFPQAFIVAFKNGRKVNVNEAIKEFKSNNK